jgi:hypothetical protein
MGVVRSAVIIDDNRKFAAVLGERLRSLGIEIQLVDGFDSRMVRNQWTEFLNGEIPNSVSMVNLLLSRGSGSRSQFVGLEYLKKFRTRAFRPDPIVIYSPLKAGTLKEVNWNLLGGEGQRYCCTTDLNGESLANIMNSIAGIKDEIRLREWLSLYCADELRAAIKSIHHYVGKLSASGFQDLEDFLPMLKWLLKTIPMNNVHRCDFEKAQSLVERRAKFDQFAPLKSTLLQRLELLQTQCAKRPQSQII